MPLNIPINPADFFADPQNISVVMGDEPQDNHESDDDDPLLAKIKLLEVGKQECLV